MKKTLGDLELQDFDVAPVWASDIAGCDDESVEPRPDLTAVPQNIHGLWVRFSGALSDGTPVRGIAMADCPPRNLILHSFFIEGEWYSLHYPPAPEFVLAQDGPDRFAAKLRRSRNQVFPIAIRSDIPSAITGVRIDQLLSVKGPVV